MKTVYLHPANTVCWGIISVKSSCISLIAQSWVLSYPLSAQRRLRPDWADAQADLSLRWAHSHFVGFVMIVKACIISSYACTYIQMKKINIMSHGKHRNFNVNNHGYHVCSVIYTISIFHRSVCIVIKCLPRVIK